MGIYTVLWFHLPNENIFSDCLKRLYDKCRHLSRHDTTRYAISGILTQKQILSSCLIVSNVSKDKPSNTFC